jgi:hypothetical protein
MVTPTKNVKRINLQLEMELGTNFRKGDLKRFGTKRNGTGLLF